MADTTETIRSYPMLGTVGRGLFSADDGRLIRVHRIGEVDAADRRYVLEVCRQGDGPKIADRYPIDPTATQWEQLDGSAAAPVDSVAGIATDADYYGLILPALRRLGVL